MIKIFCLTLLLAKTTVIADVIELTETQFEKINVSF